MTSDEGVLAQTIISAVSAFLTLLAIAAAIWIGLEPRRLAERKANETEEQAISVIHKIVLQVVHMVSRCAFANREPMKLPDRSAMNEALVSATEAMKRLQRFDRLWYGLPAWKVLEILRIEDVLAELARDARTSMGGYSGDEEFSALVQAAKRVDEHGSTLLKSLENLRQDREIK